MAAEQSFSRIYELKGAGVDKLLSEINTIISRLEKLGQVKNSIGGGEFLNSDGMAAFNAQMEQLIKNVDKVAVATDKNAASQSKLADSLEAVMAIQKNVSANMQQSTVEMGENLTISSVALTKVQGAMSTAKVSAQDYDTAILSLGTRLAELKDAAATTVQQLKLLSEEYEKNKITEADFQEQNAALTTQLQQQKTQITEVTGAMTVMNKVFNPALVQEETTALFENRVELQQRNQLLKLQAVAEAAVAGSRGEARAQAALLRKELDQLNVTTVEGIEQQKALIAEIDRLDAFINANSEAYTRRKINIGNYPELTIQAQELKTKMDELTASGEAETEVFKQLEVEALKVASAMKSIGPNAGINGSGFTSPTFLGGPSFAAQLKEVKTEMYSLAEAGKVDTERFAELSAESKRLQAAIEGVELAVNGATEKIGRFQSTVERMGIRFLANLLIFQLAIKLYTELSDAYKQMSDRLNFAQVASEEIAKNMANSFQEEAIAIDIMKSRFNDLSTTLEDKKEIVEELNGKIKEQYGAINNVNDAEAFFIEKSSAFIQALTLRAQAQANLTALTKEYQHAVEVEANPEDELNVFNKIYSGLVATGKTLQGLFGRGPAQGTPKEIYEWTKAIGGANQANAALNDSYNKQAIYLKNIISLQHRAAELDKKNGFETDNPDKTKKDKVAKQPHDYTAALLEAQKKLTDGIAKEASLRLQIEISEQSLIFNNIEKSLQDRLKAYAIYATDEKKLLQLQKETAIKDVQDRLDKIAEIEGKPVKKRTVEENTLLINKSQLSQQLKVLQDEYTLKLSETSNSINAAIGGIVKSNLDKTFKEIDTDSTEALTKLIANYTEAENNIYASGKSEKRKDKEIGKLDEGLKVQTDETSIVDDKQKINATIYAIQEAHNTKMVELEAQLQRDLQSLYKKEAQDKNNLQADLHKNDDKKVLETLKDGALEVAQTFANSYMQLLEKEDAYRQEMAQRSLSWNQQLMQSESQSKNQQLAQARANQIAEQELAKEKSQQDRKRAEETIIINAVIASGSSLAKDAPDWPKFAADESIILAQTAIQEAFLARAPAYAEGTEYHPGGWAFVGDGGEPELAKIGNKYFITPATTTAVNLPVGASVKPPKPMTQLPGNLGANLQAPRFNATSTNTTGNSYDTAFKEIHSTLQTVVMGMANMKVSLNTGKAGRAIKNDFFKTVHL